MQALATYVVGKWGVPLRIVVSNMRDMRVVPTSRPATPEEDEEEQEGGDDDTVEALDESSSSSSSSSSSQSASASAGATKPVVQQYVSHIQRRQQSIDQLTKELADTMVLVGANTRVLSLAALLAPRAAHALIVVPPNATKDDALYTLLGARLSSVTFWPAASATVVPPGATPCVSLDMANVPTMMESAFGRGAE